MMGNASLELSMEERNFLADYLSIALKEVQVEEHRTRSPSYREFVTHNKELLASIVCKLQGTAACGATANGRGTIGAA